MGIIRIKFLLLITIPFFFTCFSKAQGLSVGVNYHSHDNKNIDKIKSDFKLMKGPDINVVCMKHLVMDGYELTEVRFDFECFDNLMDLM